MPGVIAVVARRNMKPTKMDLEFWAARKAPMWARTMLKFPPNPGKHLQAAIEFRGDVVRITELARHARPGTTVPLRQVRRDYLREASNAVNVLGMVRRRGERLGDYMRTAAIEYATSQPSRANIYRRWLRRMEKRTQTQ